MVRGPGLSKGCATCRKRKIKCDERSPSCSQCWRIKQPCPGAVAGSIFLYETTGDRASRRGKREDQNTQQAGNRDKRTLTNSPRAFENILSLQQQLVSMFTSFFAKSSANRTKETGWMTLLPGFIATANSESGLKWPTLAASFALQSQFSHDPKLEAQARKWYGYGLHSQRIKLSCGFPPTQDDISGAILLAYYEIISPTLENAYCQHILGAQALLELTGPQSCQEGYLYQLLRTVRLHTVYISLSMQAPSILASEEWRMIPFSKTSKTPCDYVLDILLQFPSHLQRLRKQDLAYTKTKGSVRMLIAQLSSLWGMLYSDVTTEPMNANLGIEEATKIYIDIWKYIPSHQRHGSSELAVAMALYSLGWIIAIAKLGMGPSDKREYNQLLIVHCNAIIAAAVYLGMVEDGCAYIRMVFPLRIVEMLSPDSLQREAARYRLQFWASEKGLAGISSIAETFKI